VEWTGEGDKPKQAETSEAEKDLKTIKGLSPTISARAGETGGIHGQRMRHDSGALSGLSSN
jgi:hypothetical protein